MNSLTYIKNFESSQGEVYLMQENTSGKYFILKQYWSQLEFKRERDAYRALKGVPCVTQVCEELSASFPSDLVLEYHPNGDLFNYLAKPEELSLPVAKCVLIRLLNGVHHIHQNNICHRDIKPENIFFDEDMDIRIGDFGHVDFIDPRSNPDFKVNKRKGTPAYRAPESFTSAFYDGRKSDVWMCGVVFFVMLAKYLPFEEDGAQPGTIPFNELEVNGFEGFWRWHQQNRPMRLSDAERIFLEKCFSIDPASRWSVTGLLSDPWLNEDALTHEELCLALKHLNGQKRRCQRD